MMGARDGRLSAMGTPAENKALVERFLKAFGTGDIATAADCFDAERYYSNAYEADLAGNLQIRDEVFGGQFGAGVGVDGRAQKRNGLARNSESHRMGVAAKAREQRTAVSRFERVEQMEGGDGAAGAMTVG